MSHSLLGQRHLGVICAAFGTEPISPDDWASFLRIIEETDGEEVRVLIRSAGSAPAPQQRRALFEITRQRYFQIAVLTNSPDALRLLAEFEWLGHIEVRGFSFIDFDRAFEYLQVSDDFFPGLERKLLALTEQLKKRNTEPATKAASGSGERDQSGIRGGAPFSAAKDEAG